MRTKIASILAAGWMMSTAGVALAEHHEGGASHWSLMGKEGHLGAQYRFQLTHNDNNFASSKDTDATKTTTLELSALNLQMDGRLNKAVTFDANIHLVGSLPVTGTATDGAVSGRTLGNFIHWAYLDWAMSDMITLRGGRDFVNAGGWDNNNRGQYFDWLGSAYRAHNPLTSTGTADMVEVMVKAGGWVSLQLVNDTTSGSKNTAAKQPAMILEYKGEFGAVSPLVQIGQYDLNEDRFFVLGVKFKAAGIDGFLDYINDSTNTKSGDETTTDVTTAINLRLNYSVGAYTPFFELTQLDVKQDGEDSKVNSTVLPSASPDFDDNAMNWAIGVRRDAPEMGGSYSPFVVIRNHSGKFVDSTDDNKEVTRSAMSIQAGVLGEF